MASYTSQVRSVRRVRDLEDMLAAESDPNRRAIIIDRLRARRIHTKRNRQNRKRRASFTGQVQRLTSVSDLETLLAAEPRFDPNRQDIILARIAELTDAPHALQEPDHE